MFIKNKMNMRPITIEDYPKMIDFWKAHYLLTPLDDYERVKLFLDKNPGLSLRAEKKEQIVGTVLASFDGRRGSLQKIDVGKDYRGIRITQYLVKQDVKKMKSVVALD